MTREEFKTSMYNGDYAKAIVEFDRLKAIEDAKPPNVLPCLKCGVKPELRCVCNCGDGWHSLDEWNAANAKIVAANCPFCGAAAEVDRSAVARCPTAGCAGSRSWWNLDQWNRRPEAKP